MTHSTNQELIQRWHHEPAPLLPLLHSFHDRDGYLSEEAIRAIATGLNIPLAELYGIITFYHHLAREQPGQAAPRICTGPVCRQRGSLALLASLKEKNATSMPCSGRCDAPIPVLCGHQTLIGTQADNLQPQTSPLPRPNPGGYEECIFAAIRKPARASLDGYRASGGYTSLQHVLQELKPTEVINIIKDSQLAGRGGAGFPTGQKWQAVAAAPGNPKTIVCNADEGEPGCFKDRAVMDYDPHAVIEGILIAAYATGAPRAFIYLRYEYPETLSLFEKTLDEANAAGVLGNRILSTDFSCHIYLRRGAGAYICGEEGSLLNSLEGKHPFPRNRPPFPVTQGFENKPTAVNNVETLASVAQILQHGAAWYRNLGLNGNSGTKLISLSGDIQHPGNYEVPIGLPLKTLLYDWAGGPPLNRQVQAVTMAGLSGGFLGGAALEDVTLDDASIRQHGSFLGAGGIIVYDNTRNMVEEAHAAMEFFAEESCGKCFPCRIGTQRLTERLAGTAGPNALAAWADEVDDIGYTMKETSACGLGMAAPNITESLMKYFAPQVATHINASSDK